MVLLLTVVLQLVGCMTVSAQDLMEGIEPNLIKPQQDLEEMYAPMTDFALRLFRETMKEGENTLISPLSVVYALAMTANGAKGETREQMEAVLGMPTSKWNLSLYSYLQTLPCAEKYRLRLANSVWFTDDERFHVNRAFLQLNADYYGAAAYRAPFDDATCKNINRWVERETDGMIKEILDEIPAEAVMYLVNALAFEAEWEDVYEKDQVREGVFTEENGKTEEVSFLYSGESKYLQDDVATGFLKYYKDRKYAFVALLPRKGVSVADYLRGLNGESLHAMLSNPVDTAVRVAIPKFESDYAVEMSHVLESMGMVDAFDGGVADFSGLGRSDVGNLYINRVLHKTHISVGEKGTRAGAATVVEIFDECVSEEPLDVKEVYLDRPFVYMLIDCENNLPFFIGTAMEIAN